MIGNLDDMTFRAIQTAKSGLDCEDTRNTGLYQAFWHFTKRIQFHRHNAKRKKFLTWLVFKSGQVLLRFLILGRISDPGLIGRQPSKIAVVLPFQIAKCRDFCDCQWFSATATYLLRFLTKKVRPAKAIFDSKRLQKLRFSMNPHRADTLEYASSLWQPLGGLG